KVLQRNPDRARLESIIEELVIKSRCLCFVVFHELHIACHYQHDNTISGSAADKKYGSFRPSGNGFPQPEMRAAKTTGCSVGLGTRFPQVFTGFHRMPRTT